MVERLVSLIDNESWPVIETYPQYEVLLFSLQRLQQGARAHLT